MKWKLASASLVMSMMLCTQSYGFDLLDRMLGGSGCGTASSCCETQVSCCDVDPCCDPCGNKPLIEINLPKIRPLFKINTCKSSCMSACEVVPACGCDMTPSCGCDPCNTCKPKLRLGLLDRIFASKKCCNVGCGCEATCGVDYGCGCGSMGHTHSHSGDSAPAPAAEGDSASLPPTPIVDPSAFVAPRGLYNAAR